MSGVRIEINEFVASALLIAVAAVVVGYWQTHRAPAEVIKEATVKVETLPVPPAKVIVRVIYPKPKPEPKAEMFIEPVPQEQPEQPEPGKVWDNDNMLRASDPPTFGHRMPQVTAALKDGQ